VRRLLLASLVLVALAGLALVGGPALAPVEAQQGPCAPITLHPVNPNLPTAQSGQPYLQHVWITPSNLCIPPLWSTAPSPPAPGLTLVPGTNGNDAWLQGVPTTPGTYTFTVTVGGTFICGTICWQSKTYTLVVL